MAEKNPELEETPNNSEKINKNFHNLLLQKKSNYAKVYP